MLWTRRAGRCCRLSLALLFADLFFAYFCASASHAQLKTPSAAPNETFEHLSTEAASAREAGRVEDALRYYQSALKLQPDWAEGWWYVGTLNYDGDHYTEAIPALRKLVALAPKMGPALAFLGLSEFEVKDYKNALVHLQTAQQFGYGDDADLAKVAIYHLGLLYNWSGKFDRTVAVLSPAAKQRQPPDEIKMALGMALLRIPLLSSEVDPRKDALIHAAGDAAALLYGDNPASAADALRQLLVDYPKTPYLHYAYAVALEAADKRDDALRELAEEVRVSPKNPLPYVRMAALNLDLHRPKEALASARKAVLLGPRSAEAHEILARTLKALGQTQEAANESTLAKKLEAGPAEIEAAQRQLYARGRAGENAGSQTEASAHSEGDFEELAQKAAAAQAAGQMDDTISYYKRALGLRPQWEEGWRNLGIFYYASARYNDATTALENSSAIDPRNGSVWALLGLSEFETKDYKNALIHLQRGRDLGFAGNAAAVQVARYHLAILLNRKGDFDRATELLTPETGAGPLDQQVKFALGMALLRIPLLPEELDPSKESLVRLAGETAALLSESKYDLAFARFQQLLQMAPETPYLHYAYGSALASASRYDEAEAQLVEETRISPSSALPYLRRGTIALQLRNAAGAQSLAQKAVQLAPESAEAHYLLGRSCLELGKAPEAVKELETARGLAPNSPEVRFSLARAYTKTGQPEAAEQERATFERLNAMVQEQKSRTGSQAYGAIQNRNGIGSAEGAKPEQAAPRPQ